MKTKVQKKEEVQRLRAMLPASNITIFTTFAREGSKGLSVAQMQELRAALREVDGQYATVKKTLLDLALKNIDHPEVDVYGMQGSLGVAVASGDSYVVAKKLYEFAKKNEALEFFGALVDGKFVDKDAFIEMAKMPSRDALLARLAAMMQYPLTSLAIVLKQVAEQKENAPAVSTQ